MHQRRQLFPFVPAPIATTAPTTAGAPSLALLHRTLEELMRAPSSAFCGWVCRALTAVHVCARRGIALPRLILVSDDGHAQPAGPEFTVSGESFPLLVRQTEVVDVGHVATVARAMASQSFRRAYVVGADVSFAAHVEIDRLFRATGCVVVAFSVADLLDLIHANKLLIAQLGAGPV